MKKHNKIIAIFLEIVTAVSAIIGVMLCLAKSSGSFMGGTTTLLYFTIQSNLWIAFILLTCVFIQIIEIIKKVSIFPKWLYTAKQIFTVSITLTGIVFCTMIAPFMGSNAWTLINILTHVIVPIGTIIDFLVFSKDGEYTYKKAVYAVIPPLYYLFFAIFGFLTNVDFGGGKNYPYVFLNYGGSAGVFGFSTDTSDSLFLGSFYWIILLIAFVVGVSILYTMIINNSKKSSTK